MYSRINRDPTIIIMLVEMSLFPKSLGLDFLCLIPRTTMAAIASAVSCLELITQWTGLSPRAQTTML